MCFDLVCMLIRNCIARWVFFPSPNSPVFQLIYLFYHWLPKPFKFFSPIFETVSPILCFYLLCMLIRNALHWWGGTFLGFVDLFVYLFYSCGAHLLNGVWEGLKCDFFNQKMWILSGLIWWVLICIMVGFFKDVLLLTFHSVLITGLICG